MTMQKKVDAQGYINNITFIFIGKSVKSNNQKLAKV